MKKLKLTFLILFCSAAAFSQHPFKQKLGRVATITFPDTPKMEHDTTATFYSVVTGPNIYLAQITPAKKSLKDLFTSHLNDSVYAGVIKGSLTTSKGKLLYKKNINVNGLDGIEFCYSGKIKSIQYYRYHQAFYFNSTLIIYGFWTPDSLRNDDKQLKSFFGTFKLAIKDDAVRQDNVSDIGFRVGYVIGILLIISVIVALGFGVVFVIKKITYK